MKYLRKVVGYTRNRSVRIVRPRGINRKTIEQVVLPYYENEPQQSVTMKCEKRRPEGDPESNGSTTQRRHNRIEREVVGADQGRGQYIGIQKMPQYPNAVKYKVGELVHMDNCMYMLMSI